MGCGLVAALVAAIGLTEVFNGRKDAEGGGGEAPSPVGVPPPGFPAPRLPIRQIAAKWKEDAAKAAAHYGGGPILFELRVDEAATAYGKKLIVVEKGDDRRGGERYGAIFADSYAARLAAYQKGSILRGHGKFSDAANGLVLDDCEVDD